MRFRIRTSQLRLFLCLVGIGRIAYTQNVNGVIHSVEFVQTIQQLQTLDELQASLKADGQPPVAIFANRATALRVYGNPALKTGTYKVVATLPGVAKDATQSIVFDKNTPSVAGQRLARLKYSPIFSFKAPAGNWSVTLNVLDKDNKALAGPLKFDFKKSVVQRKLAVSTVFVCDAKNGAGEWLCPQRNTVGAGVLKQRFRYLSAVLPALDASISPNDTQIELEKSKAASEAAWYKDVLKQIGLDAEKREKKEAPAADVLPFYLGLARPTIASSIVGMAGNIPGRTALALSETESYKKGDTSETWAHEIGHGLGLRHTNLDIPKSTTFPGCYVKAADPTTYWPFADNRIRSEKADKTTPLEVGFNAATGEVVRQGLTADNEFELMAYCLPQWITPLNYNKAATMLAPGAGLAPLSIIRSQQSSSPDVLYWELTGDIDSGVATIDPIFQSMLPGPPDSGSGDYQIVVTDAQQNILWQQHFNPNTPWVENNLETVVDAGMYFTALVPFQATAQRISIQDGSGSELAYVLLHRVGPVVNINTPLGGATVSGLQQLNWTAIPASPAILTSRVEYSPDLGASWIQIAQNTDTGLLFDFSNVPGSNTNSALIRVSTSDGIAMGQTVSPAFTVTEKTPSDAVISNPLEDASYGPEGAIVLQGGALETDAILTGAEVSWNSSIDGALGGGETLVVSQLSPGHHTITMTATNAANQSTSTNLQLNVASGLPMVSVASGPHCVVTLGATADPYVALSTFAYSLDGGGTYENVSVTDLPIHVSITTGNPVSVVAYAIDAANQLGFAAQNFTFNPPCR